MDLSTEKHFNWLQVFFTTYDSFWRKCWVWHILQKSKEVFQSPKNFTGLLAENWNNSWLHEKIKSYSTGLILSVEKKTWCATWGTKWQRTRKSFYTFNNFSYLIVKWIFFSSELIFPEPKIIWRLIRANY